MTSPSKQSHTQYAQKTFPSITKDNFFTKAEKIRAKELKLQSLGAADFPLNINVEETSDTDLKLYALRQATVDKTFEKKLGVTDKKGQRLHDKTTRQLIIEFKNYNKTNADQVNADQEEVDTSKGTTLENIQKGVAPVDASNTSSSQRKPLLMIEDAKPEQRALTPMAAKFVKNNSIAQKMLYASAIEKIHKMMPIAVKKPLLMIEDGKAEEAVDTSKDATLENENTSNSSSSIGIKVDLAEEAVDTSNSSSSIGIKVALAATAVAAGLVGLSAVIGYTLAQPGVVHAIAQAGAALTISILPAVAAFMLTPTGIGLGIGLLLAATALVGYLSNSKTPTEVLELEQTYKASRQDVFAQLKTTVAKKQHKDNLQPVLTELQKNNQAETPANHSN